jgi:DHA1 family multidrug resistance protein-like MFS transporter
MEALKEILRDAPFGQLLRYVTGNRVLLYPEELPGFEVPAAYYGKTDGTLDIHNNSAAAIRPPTPTATFSADLEKLPSRTAEVSRNSTSTVGEDVEVARVRTIDRIHSQPYSQDRLEADRHVAELALHGTKSASHAVVPTKTADGLILADWYTTDDPADPHNCKSRHVQEEREERKLIVS